MTHVLLDTGLEFKGDIRARLARWGFTVGEATLGDSLSQWPSIQECDLVVMAGDSVGLSWGDNPAVDVDQWAPVILLGVSGPLLLVRDAWQVLSEANPSSNTLRPAVQTCLDQVSLMRQTPQNQREREDFLSFLGHEMRSPLTAAKTALEVLQGDLGGLEEESGEPDPRLKMLEIALRSIRRLHNTVEWSHDLMGLSSVNEKVLLQEIEAQQWCKALQEAGHLPLEYSPRPHVLHTDPQALIQLLNQVVRALNYAYPDHHRELSIQADAQREDTLCLVYQAYPDENAGHQPRISRLGLSSPGVGEASGSTELEQLLRFVVSRVLVSSLGAELEVAAEDSLVPEIRIWVPLGQGFSVSAEKDARLLPAI